MIEIDWNFLNQERFDRIVEALIHRMYDATADVRVINGRGGDGGCDIIVIQGKRVQIFQLKFFLEGFTSEHRRRRRQIRDSFDRAMEHEPHEWTLVVPCNLTIGERDFVKALPTGRDVKVTVMDRATLDSQLSALPDLVKYFTRDEKFIEEARILNQELANLVGGKRDLDTRLASLAGLVDCADPDWTLDFSREGDEIVYRPRAKHPRAPEVSPIMLTVESSFGPDDVALAATFQRSIGFGTLEKVVLPPKTVRMLTITGPEFLSERHEDVEVTWIPLANVPRLEGPVQVEFLSADGQTMSIHEGTIINVGSGPVGRSLTIRFYEVSELTFLLPHDPAGRCDFTRKLNTGRVLPPVMLQALQLEHDLWCCARLEVRLGEAILSGTRILCDSDPASENILDKLSRLEMLASDLDAVQTHCRVYFPMPDTITRSERIALRMARLMIEGKCVTHPEADVFTATLNGSDDPTLRFFLNGEPHALRVDMPEWSIEVSGRTLRIGMARIYHPAVVVRDSTNIVQALDEGTASGLVMQVASADGEGFRFFLPEKWCDANARLIASPLGLPGFSN